jgi:hypothetical protein
MNKNLPIMPEQPEQSKTPDNGCEQCRDVVERTDVPHAVRKCPGCGREMHVAEPVTKGCLLRSFHLRYYPLCRWMVSDQGRKGHTHPRSLRPTRCTRDNCETVTWSARHCVLERKDTTGMGEAFYGAERWYQRSKLLICCHRLKEGLAQQRYVKSHRNLFRSPRSGPHPGTPHRPIRVTGVGRPQGSFCFRGPISAESVRRSGLWKSGRSASDGGTDGDVAAA